MSTIRSDILHREMLQAWREFILANAHWLLLGSVVGVLIGISVIPVLVTRIPPDYFLYRRRHRINRRYPIFSLILVAIKNLIGAAFVVAGVVLLFLPGQGLLTLLLGLMIMNYPGKFALERWLIRRPHVLTALNWLREKYDHPPLLDP